MVQVLVERESEYSVSTLTMEVSMSYMRWLATLDDTTRNDLLMAASERSTLIRLSNTLDIFKGILEEK